MYRLPFALSWIIYIPFLLVLIIPGSIVAQAKLMTNADVIRMTQANVKTNVIKEAIERAEADFDTTADGLIGLSRANVKEEIIKLIQRKQAEKERGYLGGINIGPIPAVRTEIQRRDRTYKGNYFTVTLNSCHYAGKKSVVCDFNVFNKDKEDRDFGITGFSFGVTISRMYDNLGNTAECNSAEVGNSGPRDVANSLVVSRKSVPAVLHCQSVDRKASSISKLSVEMCADGECRSVEYRDIPIELDDN
jgi:hypothetical protein